MVFFVLTDLLAEIAVWTLRKTARYSWRGLWWGISKIQSSSSGDTGVSSETKNNRTNMEENGSVELRLLVKQLKEQVEEQREQIQSLTDKTHFNNENQ